MKTQDGQIKELVDGSQTGDAATVDQSTGMWRNGAQEILTKEYGATGTVANGVAVFWLTTTGNSNGTPIFTQIFKETASFWIDDHQAQYQIGQYTVAGDLKSITITVNRLNTTSSSGLINLLGGALSFLTGIVFGAAANGTVVYLRIKGK